MKVKTKILCYSGIKRITEGRLKSVEYTVVDMMHKGTYKREINRRVAK